MKYTPEELLKQSQDLVEGKSKEEDFKEVVVLVLQGKDAIVYRSISMMLGEENMPVHNLMTFRAMLKKGTDIIKDF